MKKQNLSALAAAAFALALGPGCISNGITAGADYARFPSPDVEDYVLVYDHSPKQIKSEATITRALGMTFGAPKTQLLNNKDRNAGGIFGIFGGGALEAQNAALNKAIEQNGDCDAILGARYKLEKEDYILFAKYKCTIQGWPATVKELKKADKPKATTGK